MDERIRSLEKSVQKEKQLKEKEIENKEITK